MIRLKEDLCYTLQDDVAVEDFDDGSILFLARPNRLVEINRSARAIIGVLDEKRSLKQVIEQTARDFSIEEKTVRKDIQTLLTDLYEKGAIKSVKFMAKRRSEQMEKSKKLLANPRISLREEEDGAILFDEETEGLQIINMVGLVIWKYIQGHPRTQDDIVNHLKEVCEDVPVDQVEKDVDGFIRELLNKGFIGEVVSERE